MLCFGNADSKWVTGVFFGSADYKGISGSVRTEQKLGLNGVPHPPVFFVRVVGKGLMPDGVCKSGKERS